jgi:hypothetical protein
VAIRSSGASGAAAFGATPGRLTSPEGKRVTMADDLETTIAPAAIERAMSIFEGFKDRNHAALVQARKGLTDHIFGQIAAGQTDGHRLVVSGLTYLKSLERMTEAGRP